MLKLLVTIVSLAALSAAVLMGSPAPSAPDGTPVVTGQGKWLIPTGDVVGFEVSVVELPDGTLQGGGRSSKTGAAGNGWFQYDVVDYCFVGDEIFVIGIIDEVMNAPADWVGSWTVLGIQDNGSGGALDRSISSSGIPSFITLEQIKALLNSPPDQGGPPPADSWFPHFAGNFVIH